MEDDIAVSLRGPRRGSSGEKTPLLAATGSEDAASLQEGNLRSFDEALESVGHGVFHLILVLVSGWAIASDSVEIQCISFVTPQLDAGTGNASAGGNEGYAIQLDKTKEGVLDSIIFLGMMVGGYLWGSLSDQVGRRSCLITSLTVNGVFGLASAFSPNYPVFLVFRFFSGVGVGGSFPVVFSYFCEFFSRRTRGPFVIILAAFWILGSIFAALLAWIVIGQFNDSIHGQVGGLTIQAWRVYVILCTFPCLSAAFCMVFMPESPSFLYSKGKLRRTAKALRRVQLVNAWCRGSKGVLSVERWESVLEAMASGAASSETSKKKGVLAKVAELFRTTRDLFLPAHLRAMTVMLIIWFMYSFGYYGLLLWFPEYFKYIENCNYQRDHNCSINPLHPDHACSSSSVKCNETSEPNGDKIYLDSLYVALAAIPGTVLGILTVNVVGAKSMLTFSLVMSGLSSLLIWVIPDDQKTEQVIVILSSVFGGVSIIGWNALDVVSTSELFPVQLRSTAFGIQSVLGRIGAILGNISFGKLFAVGSTPYLPILIVASVLIFSGISALFLPSPRGEKTRPGRCAKLRWLLLGACRYCHRTSKASTDVNS